MITGDYPATARASPRVRVCWSATPVTPAVLSGDELAQLSDTQPQLRLRSVNVCARIAPEQKLRIDAGAEGAGRRRRHDR